MLHLLGINYLAYLFVPRRCAAGLARQAAAKHMRLLVRGLSLSGFLGQDDLGPSSKRTLACTLSWEILEAIQDPLELVVVPPGKAFDDFVDQRSPSARVAAPQSKSYCPITEIRYGPQPPRLPYALRDLCKEILVVTVYVANRPLRIWHLSSSFLLSLSLPRAHSSLSKSGKYLNERTPTFRIFQILRKG